MLDKYRHDLFEEWLVADEDKDKEIKLLLKAIDRIIGMIDDIIAEGMAANEELKEYNEGGE